MGEVLEFLKAIATSASIAKTAFGLSGEAAEMIREHKRRNGWRRETRKARRAPGFRIIRTGAAR